MFGLGMQEMILIGIIAVIFIGPARLPDVMRSLGKAFGEFNRSMRGARDDFDKATGGVSSAINVVRDPAGAAKQAVKDELFGDEIEEQKPAPPSPPEPTGGGEKKDESGS